MLLYIIYRLFGRNAIIYNLVLYYETVVNIFLIT